MNQTPTIRSDAEPAAPFTLGIGVPRAPSDFITYRGLPYSRVTVTLTAGGEQLSVTSFVAEYEADRFECAIADLVAELATRGHVPAWGDWRADLASMGEADLGDGWKAVVS
jgi:hypothetical protein